MYLQLERYCPTRDLRSGGSTLLSTQSYNRRIGNYIWKVMAAKLWNELPQNVRGEDKLTSFKNKSFNHLLL